MLKPALIFFLLIGLLFISCKKNELTHHTISGRVKESCTGKPIDSAFVTVYQRVYASSGTNNYHESVIATTVSNSAGAYSITFLSNTDGRYEYYIDASDSYRYYASCASKKYPLSKTASYPLDLELRPFAYVKAHITNTPPYSNSNELRINDYCGVSWWIISGNAPIDTNIIIRTLGCGTSNIFIDVKKNGVDSTWMQSFTLNPGDTAVTSINY